jgi:hypothetical protein
VSHVAAGSQHEAIDAIEIRNAPGSKGLEEDHHDLLCQILGGRYIETQVLEPIESRAIQESAAELGFTGGCVLGVIRDAAGELGIGRTRHFT